MSNQEVKTIQEKTIGNNITVRNMPDFDKDGNLILDSVPVVSTKVEDRVFNVTVVSANPPYNGREATVGISDLMRLDAAELSENSAAHSQPI
tara:strand:+ start:144 stop:419 length:276 start_codon:yes stop_codon:yes gene_type:complete